MAMGSQMAGLNATQMQEILDEYPELAEAMAKSLGGSLMPQEKMQYGQTVGPYSGYVSNPIGAMAQGAGQGYAAGLQMNAQREMMNALRDRGPSPHEYSTAQKTMMGGPGNVEAFGGMNTPYQRPNFAGPTGSPVAAAGPGGYGAMQGAPAPAPGSGKAMASPLPPPPPAPAIPMPQRHPSESEVQYQRRLQQMMTDSLAGEVGGA